MITRLTKEDVKGLHRAFSAAPYNKPLSIFEEYFQRQCDGLLEVFVFSLNDAVIAYGVLTFCSPYPPFAKAGIPEIKDLNVLVEHRNRGYGTQMIKHMESIALEKGYPVIGIGVGVTPDYDAAKRLYPALGYVSDGLGVHPDEWGGAIYSTKCLNQGLVQFCKKSHLGDLLVQPEILTGGLLHKTWKITTDRGMYVIKELNPTIIKKRNGVRNYEVSEKIANAFKANGLPAVAAMEIDSCFVHPFEGGVYIVYPFADGHIVHLDQITKEHGYVVGTLFKRLHSAEMPPDLSYETRPYDAFSNDYLSTLIHDSKNPQLIKLLPDILAWNSEFQEAILQLNKKKVLSHRDLHYSNVLWNGLKPSIIDWESAGYTNLLQELIGFAFEWAGVMKSQFRLDIFEAILSSYAPQGFSPASPLKEAFFGWLANSLLGWMEFNLRRTMQPSFSASEKIAGEHILSVTVIPCLSFIKQNLDRFLLLLKNK